MSWSSTNIPLVRPGHLFLVARDTFLVAWDLFLSRPGPFSCPPGTLFLSARDLFLIRPGRPTLCWSPATMSRIQVREKPTVVWVGAHFLKTPYKKVAQKEFRWGGAYCGGAPPTFHPQGI